MIKIVVEIIDIIKYGITNSNLNNVLRINNAGRKNNIENIKFYDHHEEIQKNETKLNQSNLTKCKPKIYD